MTIDEAIAMLKFNNKHIADLENDDFQQLAEWLEELKELREYKKEMELQYLDAIRTIEITECFAK